MKILQDIWLKIKAIRHTEWLILAILVLVAFLSFGLGRLSVIYGEKGEFRIEYPENQQSAAYQAVENTPEVRNYVASKSGAKYHLPWCSGAQTIKEENKIYFATKKEAEASGYEPAKNCKGI